MGKLKEGGIIIIYFILSFNLLHSQISEQLKEKLIKITKRLKINIPKYKSKQCPSKKIIRKLIKMLNDDSIAERNKAYTSIKTTLRCKQTKNYLKKHINKVSPTAKYLIHNAVIESGVDLDLPTLKKNTPSQPLSDKRKIHSQQIPTYAVRKDAFQYLESCSRIKEQRQQQIIGGLPILIQIQKIPSLPPQSSQCSDIVLQKGLKKPPELLNLILKCLQVYGMAPTLYKINKYHLFKKKLLGVFKSSIANIALTYFEKRADIMENIDKHSLTTDKYYLSDKEKLLYIEGILLYFFSHLLNNGNLLDEILNTVSNDDLMLTTFLSMPFNRSKRSRYYLSTIVQKLNAQRIQNDEYLLQAFICLYHNSTKQCKNFNSLNFKTMNPITDYNKFADVIKDCLKE